MYGDRLNQVDLRVGKILFVRPHADRHQPRSLQCLQREPVLSQNNNFAAWQLPTSILTARYAKISVQLDF